MKLQELQAEEAQRWFDALPAHLRLVSLSPRFVAADAHRSAGLRPRFVGVQDATRRWLHCFHLRALPGAAGAWGAISAYGYGGALATSDEADFLQAAWTAYGAWCRSQGVLAEFCRFHPEAGNQRFFGGTVTENRMTVSMDLTKPNLADEYNGQARRKLRRAAAAGAQARFSRDPADWSHFAAFYRQAMQAIGAAPGYLFGDGYFEALSRLPQSWLCVCEAAGRWLSAGVYLLGDEVVEYHLGASSPQGHDAGTAYLMQHAAALRGKAGGARALYLGGGTTPEPDNTLLFYKKSFSRRLLPFHTGHAIHDEAAYWARAALAGFDRANPPGRILLD
jgi:hypothetical protein